MSVKRIRPRFVNRIPDQPRELLCRLKESLDRPDVAIRGEIYGHHAVLKVPEGEVHFWSPQLSIDIEPDDGGKQAVVRGLYGPRPAVWTMFVGLYAMWIFCGLMGLVIGYSQWSLDRSPTFLWAIPVAIVLCMAVYGLAFYGQHLGNSQMVSLGAFLEKALAGPDQNE